eukprot:Hpha_TRINITY_DN16745_c2_g7::TRINITY_DN16745_c2_g7_i1::g.77627::m.77627/K19756/RSPH4A; radial spoke head protein 4A
MAEGAGFDLEHARGVLQEADSEGYSVYEHVCNMVAKIIDDKKTVPLEGLPEFSQQVKARRFQPSAVVPTIGKRTELDARDVCRAQETRELFARAPPVVETSIERPRPTVTVTTTETRASVSKEPRPLSSDVRYHRMCGVGLPKHEYFVLEQSITKLVQEKKLQDVRFVGKIFGTQGNYLVVSSRRWFEDPEAKIWKEKHEMPRPPRKNLEVPVQPEPPGIGSNRTTFWVCSYAGAPWTPLPDVSPQQLNAARKIKKYFTGDLDAEINSYPRFPGKEIHLLRAQLSRIVASTEISPEGEKEPYEGDDDEEPEDEDADPKAPKEEKYKPLTKVNPPVSVEEEGIASFANREKWVHCSPYLFRDGRATKIPEKPEPEEGEEPEPEEDEEEKEEVPPEEVDFLRPIQQDTKYAHVKQPPEPKADEEGEEGGGDEPEPEAQDDEEEEEKVGEEEAEGEEGDTEGVMLPWAAVTTNKLYKKHGVVVVRSLRWPGAYAWLSGGTHSGCVYFGDGLKATDAAFRPEEAPRVQGEPDDFQEIADPTSMTEKLVLRGEEPKEPDEEDEEEGEEEGGDA